MVCVDGGFQAEESQELLLLDGEFGRESLDEVAVLSTLCAPGRRSPMNCAPLAGGDGRVGCRLDRLTDRMSNLLISVGIIQ